MGWRGAVRSIVAAERRAQREAASQRRLQGKHQRIVEKHLAIQQAHSEVEAHENYLRWLISIHKDYPELWDWAHVKDLTPPQQSLKKTPYEDAARTRLDNYFPGLKDRVLGRANEKREKLTAELVEAYEKDAEQYLKVLEEHQQTTADWTRLVLVADDILQKRPGAYSEAIEIASNILELEDLGKYIQFTIDQFNPNYIEVILYLHGEERIPKEIKSVLKSGKLSEKKMPIGQYHQLVQDHICSCILRLASEIFAFLPVDFALVHARTVMLNSRTGENEWMTIASVAFNRKTMEAINLEAVDPSDCLKNFVHNEKFLKTKGMLPVDEMSPEDVGITSGPKSISELLTIEAPKKEHASTSSDASLLLSKSISANESSSVAIVAALFGFPIAASVSYFVPLVGIVAGILGLLIVILRMVDRSMQRKKFSLLAAASLIGFISLGGAAFLGERAKEEARVHAEQQAKIAAGQLEEQKKAIEKIESLIKSAKSALMEGSFSKASEYLQQASVINSPSALDAKWLLDDCKKIESGSASREILTKLSDSDYLNFKRKKELPESQYFKDPDVNSAFLTSLANMDLRPIEKERSYLKDLNRKAERATLANDTVVASRTYQPQPTKRVSYTVYVTRTGSKYHSAGCRYLKSVIPMSLQDARSSGYSACSVCRP